MHSRLVALLAVAALAIACADDDNADADAPTDDPAQFAAESLDADDAVPSTTLDDEPLDPSEIPGEPVNQYSLSVRDCFDQIEDRRDGQPVTITTRIPCAEPHHFEVYAQLTYPAEHPSTYPGDEVVRDYAIASCYRKFTSWVGSDYEVSDLEIGVIIPNRENFESDAARYRGIHCWVSHVDGEPMVGTSRDSGW